MYTDDESEKHSSLDVYKYRRREDKDEIFINSNRISLKYDDMSEQNILREVGEGDKPKTYAILQETRTEFTSGKLRTTLMIYSNPIWKMFILTILFIAYLFDSWIYTFCVEKERPFIVILFLICCNFIFALDVIIVFGLKFFKKWRKTLNLVEPETNRVILDIFLAIPFSFLYLLPIYTDHFYWDAISPIVSLIRVYRIIEYFYNKSSEAGSNQWITFLFQYLILFILSVHTWTCIWYLFADRNFDIKRFRSSWSFSAVYLPTEITFDWYFVCLYWSVMILTTNALGDLFPVTTIERITAILAIVLGFLLTTIVFVGSLTSQFITITTRRSIYVRQLKKIDNYLRLIKMDTETSKRIIRYYEDLWYQKSGVFQPKLMNLLPYPLQMEICYDLNAVPLYSSLLFRKLPEAFLRRLSLDMTHQFYLPGDIVYNHNHNKTIMVCVTSGVLELLSDEDDESPMISFSKGTCFGEIALIYNIPARCTVKAATYVECQVLDKTKFIKLMVTYPYLMNQINQEVKERIDRARNMRQGQKKKPPLKLNVYASKDRKKSSIKKLKDKLRYRQGIINEDLTNDDELDQNCLDLYILSEHIKKKSSLFTCLNTSFPWILEHDCPLVKYWERYMLLIVFYVSIVFPYFIGIKRAFSGGLLFYTQIIITVSLIFNIVMLATTAVKTKKNYLTSFKKIMNYRMGTLGFYLDVIALIPFEYIVTIHSSVKYHESYRDHLFYLCKGTKLCLVWRLSNFFENLERKLLLNSLLIKVGKYCIYICLLCYWCGIILYMESCFVTRCSENSWFSRALLWENKVKGVNESSKTKYPIVTSVYFATTILLSVGYGDYLPGDHFDMALVAFLSLYGVLLIGYCVSEFSAVVTHWSRTKTAFLEVIITIDKFMRENNMHSTIKSRIMAFYELQWQYNSGVELTDENWLEKTVIPSELRKKVLHQARFKALTSIRFFQVKNIAYIQTLTETARDVILPPGEIVYYGGTVTRELYIIESGYCLVTSPDLKKQKKERVVGPGNHLGLLVLLYGVPAISTVITITHCKLISISYAAYTSALSLFPDMREHEGLLTEDELHLIVSQAKSQQTGAYLRDYGALTAKPKRNKFKSFFEQFIDNSFINVHAYYQKRKESYIKSYSQFHFLKNIAPYLLMPITLVPNGLFLKTWALLRVATAFLLCILIPVVISLAPICGLFNETIMALEVICYLDLYLMLHVAYYGSSNQLIYHPYLTAKNYLKGPFLLDFLFSFPWYAAWKIFIPKHNEDHFEDDHAINAHVFHCIMRLINVLQIYKLYSIFWAESIAALKRAYLMSVVQFFLMTLFFLNLYASILITLSCRYVVANGQEDFALKLTHLSLKGPFMNTTFHPSGSMVCLRGSWIDAFEITKEENLSATKVYLFAYYWAATSFTGAGFGDITAQDTAHMILSICINIHGALFFGYVYAKIASLKAMADQALTKCQENLKHLELFLNREKVPFTLKRTLIEYWKYQWKRTGGWSHQSILGKLHANLNEDAVLYMYEKTLKEIPLFENVEYSFFRAFAKKLEEQYFQKGFMVVRSNEVIKMMYIIYRGKVDIISDTNEVEACMGPGGIFGNIKGASQYKSMSNVVASRNIDLLRIPGREFYNLLKSYPTVFKKVRRSVESAIKDYVLPTVMSEQDSSEIETFPSTYEAGDDEEDDEKFENLESYNIDSPQKSLAESHCSRSITSQGNEHYISASFLIFKPHRWFRSSVLPDSALVIFFDQLALYLAYIDFMLLVYQMAFLSITYYFYSCLAIDIIFWYKLFLDVHTGFMNRYGDYVLNPVKVRKMYFSKIYLRRRDFLANLPISYLAFALPVHPSVQLSFFCYLRSPQLFRISYLFTYRVHKKIHIGSSNLLFKLISIGIWATILTHINACLFFRLSCLTPKQCTSANWVSKSELNLQANYIEEKYFPIYIAALWYMINLLTIAGTGDVTSQNDFEAIETIIVIVIIKFCTGLLISEMSAMITAHSSSRIAYDYGINELRDGLRDMDLSDHQMNKMWDYVRELWSRQKGRQVPELIHALPFRLRCQVMQAVYGSHIRESMIFSKTDDDFKRMLSMWMRHCVFFPGNYIVQCGDSDQCIYFIHRGEVEVLTVHLNLTESIYDILGPEDSFGVAQGLFVGVPHHFSFRARTVVDIVYLKLDEWKYLLDFYPCAARIVQRKVEKVYLAI